MMRVLACDASGLPCALLWYLEKRSCLRFGKSVTDSIAPDVLRKRDGAATVFGSHDYAHSARTVARTRETRERTVPTGMFISSAASS